MYEPIVELEKVDETPEEDLEVSASPPPVETQEGPIGGEEGLEIEEEKEKKAKPRRTKRGESIKKEQCKVCLREFNPAYMARHV